MFTFTFSFRFRCLLLPLSLISLLPLAWRSLKLCSATLKGGTEVLTFFSLFFFPSLLACLARAVAGSLHEHARVLTFRSASFPILFFHFVVFCISLLRDTCRASSAASCVCQVTPPPPDTEQVELKLFFIQCSVYSKDNDS